MLILHILIATLIYISVFAMWFSPILFGTFWAKLLGVNVEDIKKNPPTKIHMFFMMFSAIFAGMFLACLQIFLLNNVLHTETSLLYYLSVICLLTFGFLVFSTLPNYLFKASAIRMPVKTALTLWVIELKPIGIGVLFQAFYLYLVL